ncbi:XRE family transcriptional regulator [Intrasporangium chromatireducens]|uniref:XRE family transcriptional regulator n=1 Tax=Intrasporangium chromatireducens TaxID=1386088 RepID=UPI00055182AB|nr:ImmA/IrrE family metallo-endopeptidase [Intrasporangium chromatireducens]
MKAGPRPPAQSTDFDGTRLTVARRLRRKTKSSLASEVGVSPSAIAQYEKPDGPNPTQAVLAKICLALGLPREFFGLSRSISLLAASEAHFRSLRSTTAAAREQALAYGELSLEVVNLISDYIELPAVDLPELELPDELTDGVIIDAARRIRAAWGIEEGPVPSVVQLLEAHGVVALRLPPGTDPAVDAFSTNAGRRPLVFLSQSKDDKARSRFDASHELGHIVLHPDTEPGSKLVEKQAHLFAAEFLMPRDEIIDQLPRRIDWPAFHALKKHWGVSLRALVFRANALGRLSEASYRRANQQLSMWGLPEPNPLGPAESPQLLGLAKELMIESGLDFDAVLAAGRIATDVTEDVIQAGSTERPRLQFE